MGNDTEFKASFRREMGNDTNSRRVFGVEKGNNTIHDTSKNREKSGKKWKKH
jgi:hypothetical protein